MRIVAVPGALSICRLAPDDPLPGWATGGTFFTVSRTGAELSVVCDSARVPPGVTREDGWRALGVEGPLDFALTGVLASLATPLAQAHISVFAVSTFDTDYLLVRAERLERAAAALEAAGHEVDGVS